MVSTRQQTSSRSTRRRNVSEDGPDPIDRHVGVRIRQLRMARGLSQKGLGEALGVSFQQIQKYERGLNRVGASNLHRIALFLGVNVSHFFVGLEECPVSVVAADSLPTDPLLAISEDAGFPSREILTLAACYARIPDALIRRRILSLVRDLSVGAADGAGEPVH